MVATCLLISHLSSFSLFLWALSLSLLNLTHGLSCLTHFLPRIFYMRWLKRLRGGRNLRANVKQQWNTWETPRLPSFKMATSTIFLQCFLVSSCLARCPLHLGILSFRLKWPENWHTFSCNRSFEFRSKTNRALFWCIDLEFILMMKNASWWYIICLGSMTFRNRTFWY